MVVQVQGMHRTWGSCSSVGNVTRATDLMDQDEYFRMMTSFMSCFISAIQRIAECFKLG